MVDKVFLLLVGTLSFLSIILLLIVYRYTFDKTYDREYGFYVVTKYKDKKRAAEILQELNVFGIKLIERMHRTKYRNPNARALIDRLMNNYDPDFLEENDPIFTPGHKAVTMNFKRISICLRKNNGKFYDMNTLLFVFLHELSHVASVEKEHSDKFWLVFKFLLVCAVELMDYKPVDYSQSPINYCGIDVFHNPFFKDYDITPLID